MTNELIGAMIADGDCPPGVLEDALKDANRDWQEGEPLAKLHMVMGESDCGYIVDAWIAAAFLTSEKAIELCHALNRWCRDNHVHQDQYRAINPDRGKLRCPLDRRFRCGPYGVEYYIGETELRG